MQRRATRVLVILVVLSTAASAVAGTRQPPRTKSTLARLVIYIQSRLGPPWGTPTPDPVALVSTDTVAPQPKD